ncbi:MAG: VCBS repeat-containing protein [Kofleriaceae bacterium]
MIRLALVALLCACSGLDAIEPVCGNGVIDDGEDCDSSTNCQQCSITCGSAGDCPADYLCGADQLCHAPGGRFRSGDISIPFAEQGFGITDSNGDGYGDIIALGSKSATTFYGDPTAKLATRFDEIAPTTLGQPAVTDLDGDQRLDLVVPTADGLIAYTSENGVPSPYVFPIPLTNPAMTQTLFASPLDQRYLALVQNDKGTTISIAIGEGSTNTAPTVLGQPTSVCAGEAPSDIVFSQRDEYLLDDGTNSSRLIVLTLANHHVCAIEVPINAQHGPVSSTVFSRAAGTRAVVAKLAAATACPSILIPAADGVYQQRPSGTIGACTWFGETRLSLFSGVPLGHVPVGGGLDAVIGTSTMPFIATLNADGSAAKTYAFGTRSLDEIALADMNGDGLEDVVVAATGFDDLQVFTAFPDAANKTDGFLLRTIDTAGDPHSLTTGDFDGDGVGDVTYVETLQTGDRLLVAFGGHDAFTAPQVVGQFHHVAQTLTTNLLTSDDPIDYRVTDLVVVDQPDPQSLLLTILLGTPQRALWPFYNPTLFGETLIGFFGVVAGRFASSDTTDLFAFGFTNTGLIGYRIEPGMFGSRVTTARHPVSSVGSCAAPNSAGDDFFCVERSRYVALAVGDHHDSVVGLDLDDHVAAFDPTTLRDDQDFAVTAHSIANLIGDTAVVPNETYAVDLDHDGAQELVAGYGPVDGSVAGTLIRCDAAANCSAITAPELAGWSCFALAPANLTLHRRFDDDPTTTTTELVAACRNATQTELFDVRFTGTTSSARMLFQLPANTLYLEAGDIDGDRLDDILVLDNANTLHVYRQCNSRDYTSCTPVDAEK